MKKMSKIVLVIIAMAAITLFAACHSKKKTVTPATTPTSTAPDVAPPPSQSETSVKPPDDFVRETPQPTEEVFPADIEQLNRYVQDKGYIKDAFYNYDESTLDDAAQSALSRTRSQACSNR